MPAWVALPTILTTLSLLVALLGMLWDIALHIGVGRDEGPLANPAHYLILFGLFGVFAGGVLRLRDAAGREARPGRRPLHPRLGRARSAASCSPAPASTRCSASRWTTSGTGSSARTSRSGAPPT